ncbi:SGNH hydrolase-type esterase domain-containing protein [Gilbertella persicaria]|uniref:SGNH hydrolase-type esterase domain-containing protein n=1 Tax=Gilbertella persicaria TaxID=101096 RepID=UPI00222102BC|nr:SGNH hydrolase-type esterase domain-containing protein [Gilbertella persicaria]KAI8085761.1 SGNH hydrolase-type esterase domain-containing protein [Gilbertella persicaria]
MKALSLFSVLSLTVASVSAFDRIIAYADSFTDNGNDYRHSQFPPSPPNYQGRFSNGPTWLEYVAQNLSDYTVINNGYGGATTNNGDVYSLFNGFTVPGLLQQIETIEVNGTSDDLYLIYIGYNDLNSILNPDQYQVVNKNYTKEKVADNVITGVKNLIEKYNAQQFLILNVPPFEYWPVIPEDNKEYAKQFIQDYNTLVKQALEDEIQDAELTILDDHRWFLGQLENPERLGLSITNGPCSYGLGNTTICDDPETHFFWDSYHPEAKVHEALGAWATDQMKALYNI